jgi:hypothetical protein
MINVPACVQEAGTSACIDAFDAAWAQQLLFVLRYVDACATTACKLSHLVIRRRDVLDLSIHHRCAAEGRSGLKQTDRYAWGLRYWKHKQKEELHYIIPSIL